MRKAVLVLGLTTIVASLVCMHLVRELRDERARAATLEVRIAQLERMARSHEASDAPNAWSVNPFTSPHEPAVTPATTNAETTPAPQTSSVAENEAEPAVEQRVREMQARMRAQLDRRRELLQDPQYREAMRRQQRAFMAKAHPGLREALGLSAEETERFLDLLADPQISLMQDVLFDGSDPQRAQQALQEGHQRQQEEIEMQFGPEVRQRWQTYRDTLAERHRAAALQSELAMAGVPLDQQQSQALLDALIDERRRQTQELRATAAELDAFTPMGRAAPMDPVKWLESHEQAHERVLSALQSSLRPEQLARLEEVFTLEREMQKASMELMRAQGLDQFPATMTNFGIVPSRGFAVGLSAESEPRGRD